LVVAVFGAMLAPWLGIEGLDLTHAGRASLWLALSPALSAALGYLFRTERIGRIGHIGLILAGLGTLGLALDGLDPERSYWLGDLFLVIAITLVATELHLMKPLATRYGAASMVATRTAIGGLLYTLVASPSLVQQSWLSLNIWTWFAIVVGGVVGVGSGQWVQVRALRVLGPTRVVLYNNHVPLAALVRAWLVLGTVPSPLEIGAGGCIILGAVCLQVLDAPHRRVNLEQ
jgi:drug/metabolite transporter (DMT)-like permease